MTTAKDILNIANVIKKGRELTDAEIKENKNGEDKLIGFQLEKNFNLHTFHSHGILPIHSIPLSFIGTFLSSPFVTASVITDCLYSL